MLRNAVFLLALAWAVHSRAGEGDDGPLIESQSPLSYAPAEGAPAVKAAEAVEAARRIVGIGSKASVDLVTFTDSESLSLRVVGRLAWLVVLQDVMIETGEKGEGTAPAINATLHCAIDAANGRCLAIFTDPTRKWLEARPRSVRPPADAAGYDWTYVDRPKVLRMTAVDVVQVVSRPLNYFTQCEHGQMVLRPVVAQMRFPARDAVRIGGGESLPKYPPLRAWVVAVSGCMTRWVREGEYATEARHVVNDEDGRRMASKIFR